jgi:hypothetical protein
MIERQPNPVALILLQHAWRLRLQLSGFQDIEPPGDPYGPLKQAHHLSDVPIPAAIAEHHDIAPTRAEYYRRLGIESYRTPPPRKGTKVIISGFGIITPMHRSKAKDRKILRLLSEGIPIRSVMKQLHVGQGRVYRLLAKVQARIRRETTRAEETA